MSLYTKFSHQKHPWYLRTRQLVIFSTCLIVKTNRDYLLNIDPHNLRRTYSRYNFLTWLILCWRTIENTFWKVVSITSFSLTNQEKYLVFVILLSYFALTLVHSRSLPLTPGRADAQISTGEWQKPNISISYWNGSKNDTALSTQSSLADTCVMCWQDRPKVDFVYWSLGNNSFKLTYQISFQDCHSASQSCSTLESCHLGILSGILCYRVCRISTEYYITTDG